MNDADLLSFFLLSLAAFTWALPRLQTHSPEPTLTTQLDIVLDPSYWWLLAAAAVVVNLAFGTLLQLGL